MSDNSRGSDKLKMLCNGCEPVAQEQLEQVLGGLGLSYYSVFPRGIPWPEIYGGYFNQNPAVNQQMPGLAVSF